jgi:hypothetical protein
MESFAIYRPVSSESGRIEKFQQRVPLALSCWGAILLIGEFAMASNIHSSHYTRREIIRAGALAVIPLAVPSAMHAQQDQPPQGSATITTTANGGTDPYPIPWLDKNGSHNQPAGPNLEPAHIYHFKGRVARSSTFTGMGTDKKGNRIAFGSPTTDYGVMQGEYWGARTTQHGTFTHI